jgi:plasmid stability protein
MATIKIENFPDDLYEALRQQAERSGTTISAEVIETLDLALRLEKLTWEGNVKRSRRFRISPA